MNQTTKPQTNLSAVQESAPPMKLHEEIEARTEQFKGSLPAHIPVERFKKVLMVAVNTNPALVKADRRSFFNSALKAANDGLLPNGTEAALVIYKTKQKTPAGETWVDAVQYMPMIAGIRKKVRNSGEISTWNAHVVYENDQFDYELGFDERLHHKPLLKGDRGKPIAAYSVATLKTGEKSFEVMSADEIWAVWSKSSKNKDKEGKPAGPWKDHQGEMFRKTVARRHAKVLPMSTDLDDLVRRDDALYDFEGKSDRSERDVTPARPQLKDFTTNEGDTRPAPEKEQAKQQQEQATVDQETGEVTEDGEYGAPDAYQDGAKAAIAGFAIDTMPKKLTAFPALAEAWQEGWRSEQPE